MIMKFMKVVIGEFPRKKMCSTRFTPTAQSKTLKGPSSLELASRFGGVSPTAKAWCSGPAVLGPGSVTSWRNGRQLLVSAHATYGEDFSLFTATKAEVELYFELCSNWGRHAAYISKNDLLLSHSLLTLPFLDLSQFLQPGKLTSTKRYFELDNSQKKPFDTVNTT